MANTYDPVEILKDAAFIYGQEVWEQLPASAHDRWATTLRDIERGGADDTAMGLALKQAIADYNDKQAKLPPVNRTAVPGPRAVNAPFDPNVPLNDPNKPGAPIDPNAPVNQPRKPGDPFDLNAPSNQPGKPGPIFEPNAPTGLNPKGFGPNVGTNAPERTGLGAPVNPNVPGKPGKK